MRLLMIASGYLPNLFSENLCNAKLVYALTEAGVEIDVISKAFLEISYSSDWTEPWIKLKPDTYLIDYPVGNKFTRTADVVYSGLLMGTGPTQGIRWIRRAYQTALRMIKEKKYDAVLTRSPNDITHIVGYKLKQKTGIRWIANWNDPADGIWPGAYRHEYSNRKQRKVDAFTQKLLQEADLTTFPSDSLRQHFIHHFPALAKRKTEVIPHIGLVNTLFKPIKHQKDGKLRLLHSGNLSGERNPELLFQAIREILDEGFKDFELHIMGVSNQFTAGLIDRYRLGETVKYIGSFNYMEALKRMRDYDVLVLLEAILEKGIFFASKFTDYAQTGRPIFAISPREGFAHDTINRHGKGYFADNTDKCAIKNELLRIIADWKANLLEQNSSLPIFSDFAPEKVVEQYKKIIWQ